MLTALGRPELIAATPVDYVARAVALAHDRDRLATIRGSLRGQMEKSILLDAARFAREMEGLYRSMWSAAGERSQ